MFAPNSVNMHELRVDRNEVSKSTIRGGGVKHLSLCINRSSRQKISYSRNDLNNYVIQLDLTGIYKILHPTTE